MLYRVIKNIIMPFARRYWTVRHVGLENIPKRGGGLLASNHLSILDHFIVPGLVKRQIHYLAKVEYFYTKKSNFVFRNLGQIPVHRGSSDRKAIQNAIDALEDGKIIGIFPEGTRTPDGRLYGGHTGVARLAIIARVPVIPVGMVGTWELWPPDQNIPNRGDIQIRIGKPLTFEEHYDKECTYEDYRAATDKVMLSIAALIGDKKYPQERLNDVLSLRRSKKRKLKF